VYREDQPKGGKKGGVRGGGEFRAKTHQITQTGQGLETKGLYGGLFAEVRKKSGTQIRKRKEGVPLGFERILKRGNQNGWVPENSNIRGNGGKRGRGGKKKKHICEASKTKKLC